MSGSAAFSGLKLSEGNPTGGLDQRLFAAPTGNAATKGEPSKRTRPEAPRGAPTSNAPPTSAQPERPAPEQRETRPAPRITIDGKRVAEPEPAGAARWAGLAFDINIKPYRKDSFLFTDDEFEAMEDLKLELKRLHDLPATKNDIARIALQRLFEDYAEAGLASAVVSRLQGKKT